MNSYLGEYMVLVPDAFNDGEKLPPIASTAIKMRALDLFGGYTISPPVEGAWRDERTGQVYLDTMHPYAVASANWEDVESFARTVAEIGKQLAVYVRKPDGSVEFVSSAEGVAA